MGIKMKGTKNCVVLPKVQALGIENDTVFKSNPIPLKGFRGQWLTFLRLLYKEIFFRSNPRYFVEQPKDLLFRCVLRDAENYDQSFDIFLNRVVKQDYENGVSELSNRLWNILFVKYKFIQTPDKKWSIPMIGERGEKTFYR